MKEPAAGVPSPFWSSFLQELVASASKNAPKMIFFMIFLIV
jgi:hypothetical protein